MKKEEERNTKQTRKQIMKLDQVNFFNVFGVIKCNDCGEEYEKEVSSDEKIFFYIIKLK